MQYHDYWVGDSRPRHHAYAEKREQIFCLSTALLKSSRRRVQARQERDRQTTARPARRHVKALKRTQRATLYGQTTLGYQFAFWCALGKTQLFFLGNFRNIFHNTFWSTYKTSWSQGWLLLLLFTIGNHDPEGGLKIRKIYKKLGRVYV